MTQAEPQVISGLGQPLPAASDVDEHPLPVLQLDRRTYVRALDCVHCGLCLPACPTYTDNGLEADSPRGRIVLIKGLADGRIDPSQTVIQHLDLCLDCRACETACPSGVVYHELIEQTREKLEPLRKKTMEDRIVETIFYRIFPYPWRVKLAMLPARLMQRLGLWELATSPRMQRRLPPALRKMQQMLPESGPMWERGLARRYPPAEGVEKRATVGLLAGCVGSVLFQQVNRKTIDLLRRAGCEVLVPPRQRCCGAIPHHGGRVAQAERFARANIDAFLPTRGTQVDLIVNNAAGCGAMLRQYDHLLRDDPKYAERAEQFVNRCRDVSEALVELESPAPEHALKRVATYHDACHLVHGQKVSDPPRRLLAQIPDLELVPLIESDMCCGAAGTYNLAQPEMARRLAERKLRKIQETGASVCVTGNVGCAMQIASEARRLEIPLQVRHPVDLLHEACFGACEHAEGPAESAARA